MKKASHYYLIFGFLALTAVAVVLVASFFRNPGALQVAEQTVSLAGAKAQSYAAENNPEIRETDRVFGSLKAPLAIIVYEDYTNVYSANLADNLERIRQEYGSQVAIVVRPYITADSALSETATLALDCAQAEGKWVEMRALLFAQVKNQGLQAGNFSNYAQQVGLDESQFAACLTNSQKSEKIEQFRADLKSYSILGAPTLFVADEMIIGARPYEDYEDSNGDVIEGLKKLVDRKLGEG